MPPGFVSPPLCSTPSTPFPPRLSSSFLSLFLLRLLLFLLLPLPFTPSYAASSFFLLLLLTPRLSLFTTTTTITTITTTIISITFSISCLALYLRSAQCVSDEKQFFFSRSNRHTHIRLLSLPLSLPIQHPDAPLPWCCFSLVIRSGHKLCHTKIMDFVCDSNNDAMVWFLGLQGLAPRNEFYLSRCVCGVVLCGVVSVCVRALVVRCVCIVCGECACVVSVRVCLSLPRSTRTLNLFLPLKDLLF